MKRATGWLQLEVELDGAPLAEADGRALVSVHVRQRLSEPAQAELVLLDPCGPLGQHGPRRGGAVVLRCDGRTLWAGEITGVHWRAGPDGGRELRMRGYDALHRLRKRSAHRAHVETTAAALAEALLAGDGIAVDKAGEDGIGPTWARVLQLGEPDLELLQRVAEDSGSAFVLEGDRLAVFAPARGRREPPLPMQLGDGLLEVAVDVTGEPACRTCEAYGWDVLRAMTCAATIDRARSGRDVAAAFPPDWLGARGTVALAATATAHVAHAQARAQAALDRAFAREVACRGTAAGSGALRPGATVELRGVSDELDGIHVLTAVDHRLTPQEGWIAEFTSEPPRGREATPPVATLGRVLSVEDPEALGRVQVALAACGDVVSDWMPVLAPAAGGGKGLIALPAPGDTVLVWLLDPTFAQGVVLGGLFGRLGLPDGMPQKGEVRRFAFLTPGGQRLSLDDASGAIRIENVAGSFVELGREQAWVRTATPLRLEAPGQPVVIAGRSIDFQKA